MFEIAKIHPRGASSTYVKHVVLNVGHPYKPFWTKKIDWIGRGGEGFVNIWPGMGLADI